MGEREAVPSVDELLAHAGWLQRLAERLVGTGDQAEDLVQETWLAALRRGPRRGASLRPWLATVLRNFAASSARSRERRRWREEQHAPPEALPSTEELTARAEASRALVEAVLALPEAQRVVVLLRYFEQLPSPEIAARLGCPAATVRSHLSRAVERLRTQLDRRAGGDRERWVRCFAPLPAASSHGHFFFGALAMSNAAKFAALALSVTVIGLGLWSALDEKPAASTSPASTLEPGELGLVAAELPAKTAEEADEGRVAIDPRLRTIAGATPVQGVLLDRRSGEPLPWFALGVASGPPPERPVRISDPPQVLERVVTDGQGRFRSASSYSRGDMHLVPLEDWDRRKFLRTTFGALTPRPPLAFTHDPDPREPAPLELESGPAYRLHCPQAEAIGLHEFAAVLSDTERPWRGMGAITHLVDEPLALARFLPLERPRRPGLDTLHLLSHDGRWAGWASVDVRPGLASEPVAIELFPCGTLRVDVRAGSSPPLAEALVAIWEGALDAAELEQHEPMAEGFLSHSVSSRASNAERRPLAFHHRHLPLGTYTLRARSAGCADQVELVELRQGEQRIEVVLARTVDASGRIEGRVVPRSGQRPAVDCIAWLMLSGDDAAGSQRTIDLNWTERDGRWTATFAFENLLEREYRVWITLGMRVPRDVAEPSYEPRDFHVRPGGPSVEFELIEPPRARQLEVLAQDAATGDPLALFHVAAFLPASGKEPQPVEGTDGHALVELRGELEGGRLWVTAAGHAPLFTELPAAPDADGVLRATVRLDPGWGAPVQVIILDGEQRQPAAGVEILADDQVVATTDESGVAWLSLASRPERLAVRAPGLLLHDTSGSIDASGRLEEQPLEPMHESYFFVLRRHP